jgi:hypothetical protein
MFGLRKRGPTRPFAHADDCKIVKADPSVVIPWSEVESGHWQAECRCGKEHFHEAPADRRTRLDPLDPSTFRHAPQCEHRCSTTLPCSSKRSTVTPAYVSSCPCSVQLAHHSTAARSLDAIGSPNQH